MPVKAFWYTYEGSMNEDLKWCSFAVIKSILEKMSDDEKVNRLGIMGRPLAEIEFNKFRVFGDCIVARDNGNRLWKKEKDSLCWFLL